MKMMMMVLVLVSLLEFQSTLSSPAPLPTLCDREVEYYIVGLLKSKN